MTSRIGIKALMLLASLGVVGTAWADDPQFTLVIKDHKFTPTELQIPAGAKVRLVVRNDDATPEEFESTELHREKVVPPGQQIVVIVGPLEPGTYGFFGEFHKGSAQGKLIAK
ncbi:MAG TPA: cupredoxin domain-containing protein [Stellaceae bacterium]|nr:cupredoxin domain-containing protein [Stellaceae bacterium]